ncbi:MULTISPECIES: serine protease [unclassified Kaistella]|uniref:S1 family peptidase n=1 Tax=unclassified Kaistella TaxID=2762626 RepID=UPI002733D7D8|nr:MULTISPECIES: serine protease [unclassified Kaistella]MDP2455138.1 serine protease [Kaistella sp. SH11-4b]MDP2458045.1 serine protease [Kaistella sp. SH40-3]MDP2461012.1 serine protease [Kaistella sp. SH19-2b]
MSINLLRFFMVLFLSTCFLSCERRKGGEEVKNELKKISSEEIFNKYQDAVVLIKHSFVYKANISGTDFFFRTFDDTTGEISDFISKEEAEAQPNISWGTGFFIDSKGKVLTNRHVLDVRPSKEQEVIILQAFKGKLITFLQNLQAAHDTRVDRLKELQYILNNELYKEYEYTALTSDFNRSYQDYQEEEKEINNLTNFVTNFDKQGNFVTKTSLQFGIFLNNQKSQNNLQDYIKYKSVKISEDPNVDLALIEPNNLDDFNGKKITPADMTKIDSVSIRPLKITQKLTLIGYNNGANMGVTENGIRPQLTEGAVSQITDRNKVMYTIPVLPGSSGSPVFDEYGRVILINFAGMMGTQGFNYGIQPEKIKDFLR